MNGKNIRHLLAFKGCAARKSPQSSPVQLMYPTSPTSPISSGHPCLLLLMIWQCAAPVKSGVKPAQQCQMPWKPCIRPWPEHVRACKTPAAFKLKSSFITSLSSSHTFYSKMMSLALTYHIHITKTTRLATLDTISTLCSQSTPKDASCQIKKFPTLIIPPTLGQWISSGSKWLFRSATSRKCEESLIFEQCPSPHY